MKNILRILNIFVAFVLCLPSLVLVGHAYLYLEQRFDFSLVRGSMLAAFGTVGSISFAAMALWVAVLSLRRSPKSHPEDETVEDFLSDLPIDISPVLPAAPSFPVDSTGAIPVTEIDDILEQPEEVTQLSPEMRIPFDPTYECTIPQPPGWYACTRGFHVEGPCNPKPMPVEEFGDNIKTAVEAPKGKRLTLSFLPLTDPTKGRR